MDWSNTTIAFDGTHHVRAGAPLYAERFDEVLAFHAPGLAPVRRGQEAWHVHPDARAAYERRFARTFGFYEGLATVVSPDGWHHIRPDGADLSPARYAWCGNFQGGRCTVRGADGRCFHVTPDASRAYGASFRYAGDYRDGIAVVQADDGRSSHIDRDGHLVHKRWFLDLDVFHKGYARARDEAGWHHVDRSGRPAYARRFASLEPFYNGQARAERHDGAIEVIDESGRTLLEPRSALRTELASLSRDLVGYWRTQALRTAVELGVLEILPAPVEAIASRCALRADRAPRLMHALGELGIVELDEHGVWNTTPRGELLLVSHPMTLADAALEYAGPLGAAWLDLPDALREGSRWRAPDVFAEVARNPGRVGPHHRMLRSYALHDYAAVPAALELSGHETIVDAGGGLGVIAKGLLAMHPEVRVVLADRPEVLELVRPAPEYAGRLTLHAIDLRAPWATRGDGVVLARVLHDWNDGDASAILDQAREALAPGGRLFVIEMLLDERSFGGALCDLHLLAVSGGRERTRAEYERLLDAAGFTLARVSRLPALCSVIEGGRR